MFRMWPTILLMLLLLLGAQQASTEPLICVIVRTYWKHGHGSPGALERLIMSLQEQTHPRWDAQFVIMDKTPFHNFTDILHSFNDDRLWLYANWIGNDFKPKSESGQWESQYHTRLYGLTDEAARACPADTTWVVFTNGDNMYHKKAFESIAQATGSDAVALDFYSRYTRPTGIPCDRFQRGGGAHVCKKNRMRWCHTDLGAVAYSWPKLMQSGLRFEKLEAPRRFTSQDALMAEAIVDASWNIGWLPGKCLYDQGPNPISCALLGGIWDDRRSFMADDFGGHCITGGSVEVISQEANTEVVTVQLSHDGDLQGYPLSMPPNHKGKLQISCLRPERNYHFSLVRAFPEECIEDVDEALFAEYMNKSYPKKPQWERTVKTLQDKLREAAVEAMQEARTEATLDLHDEL